MTMDVLDEGEAGNGEGVWEGKSSRRGTALQRESGSRFYRIFYVIVSIRYSRYIERDEVQEAIVAELEIVLVRWQCLTNG